MPGLLVTYSKLAKYTKQHGGYDLTSDGREVVLTFVPSFPEALEKGDSDVPPRVTMHGILSKGRVKFDGVEVEDQRGVRTKNMRDAELTYKGWLDFVEENY